MRCLRRSETCEVSEITICSELQLFTDISDNIFVVVICRMIVPSNKGILAAYLEYQLYECLVTYVFVLINFIA